MKWSKTNGKGILLVSTMSPVSINEGCLTWTLALFMAGWLMNLTTHIWTNNIKVLLHGLHGSLHCLYYALQTKFSKPEGSWHSYLFSKKTIIIFYTLRFDWPRLPIWSSFQLLKCDPTSSRSITQGSLQRSASRSTIRGLQTRPAFLVDAHNCMNQLRQDAASKDIVMKSGHMFIDILY